MAESGDVKVVSFGSDHVSKSVLGHIMRWEPQDCIGTTLRLQGFTSEINPPPPCR